MTPLLLLLILQLMSGLRGTSDNDSQLTQREQIGQKIQLAIQFHKRGEFVEAVSLYDQVLPFLDGKTASQIASNAGAIYLQQGEVDLAVLRFLTAVEASPENSESHFNLAVSYNSKLNKSVLAIKHCRLAIKYDPNMHKAYHLMANILQDLGKPEEAMRYFNMAQHLAHEQLSPKSLGEHSLQSTAYSTLWVWSAQINTTYYFQRINDVWKRIDSLEVTHVETCESQIDILEMKCLSERPLIFEIPRLLSNIECDHILNRAQPLLQSSHVMGKNIQTSESHESSQISEPYRKSRNAWLPRDDVLDIIQTRVATLAGIPEAYVKIMSEDLQVIQYDPSEQFKLHQDSSDFHPRMLTALVYLQDLDQSDSSGETWFPFAPGTKDRTLPALDSVSSAVASLASTLQDENDHPERLPSVGLAITPVRGRAVLFFNHLRDGQIDSAALHSGRRVLHSTKWAANYWVKFDPVRLDQIVEENIETE